MYVIPPVIVRVGCPPVWVSIDENTRLILMVVTFRSSISWFQVSGVRFQVTENTNPPRIDTEEHGYLTCEKINYLKTTGMRVGLLFNFGANKFEMLRRIF